MPREAQWSREPNELVTGQTHGTRLSEEQIFNEATLLEGW